MEIIRRYAVPAANGRQLSIHRRRALGYVYFLSIVMLVMVVGLSALMYARIQLRSAQAGNHAMAARFYAQSALELGFLEIRRDPSWRSNRGTGVWFTDQPIGSGRLTLAVNILTDGDANPDNNPVLLIGIGIEGQATHKIEARLGALSAMGGMVTSAGSRKRFTG